MIGLGAGATTVWGIAGGIPIVPVPVGAIAGADSELVAPPAGALAFCWAAVVTTKMTNTTQRGGNFDIESLL